MTDRARPGLVALYDIRPGNGAGPFLQPRSPHGALSSLFVCLGFNGTFSTNRLHRAITVG